jgi:pectinesterase
LPLLAVLSGTVASGQPPPMHACSVLPARRTAPSGELDTARIQAALSLCSPGHAVVLQAGGSNRVFESAPLIVPRGVTLFVGEGVTLYASRNPRDYDLAPQRCGEVPSGKAALCKPFLFAYQAAFSGVAGPGMIDGQGGVWWELLGKAKSIAVPELVSSYESQGFRIDGITLRNAAAIHAAIYKTIGLTVSQVHIDSPASSGLLLSNATDANVNGLWARVAGEAIRVEGSILGVSSRVRIRNVYVSGGQGIRIAGGAYDVRDVEVDDVSADGAAPPKPLLTADTAKVARPGAQQSLVVSPDGEFPSVQSAVDALPVTGGEITVKTGTYREVVTIRKPHVHLHGESADPAAATIVYGNGAPVSGGTFDSATVFVEADDVTIDHLTIANDFGVGKGQAVALAVTGDRAIFRNLRILGAQDTLFAASRYCYGDYGPCVPARQYFADCYIEGNVDFIFGDSQAVFDRCQIHGIPQGDVMYTAQSRHTAEQTESGYVFDHCRLTGDARADGMISLGRPWRPYATVVFLYTQMDAPVIPVGWTEWLRFGKPSLPTAYYAEYESAGPGANPRAREPYAHQLTREEAERWSVRRFVAGKDGWDPTR